MSLFVLGLAAMVLLPVPALAAGRSLIDGSALNLAWGVPFAGILLSIAVLPLAAPTFWHDHFGKVSAFWALAFLAPFAWGHGLAASSSVVLHTLVGEYIPFIILVGGLYTVAGGVRLRGTLVGTPLTNTFFLALGTVLASIMGTTGAAMLLIRPVIEANAERRHKVHVVVFFIFLVANIGGCLTPLGDPPLFLGFLNGVHFFWTVDHLLLPLILSTALLLGLFFAIDTFYARQEHQHVFLVEEDTRQPLRLEGGINFLFLLGILAAVLLSGVWKPGVVFEFHHVRLTLQDLLRDVLILAMAAASWRFTHPDHRHANAFSWAPIIEVAKLFAGIFLTIIPVIAILQAGEKGSLGGVVHLVTDKAGEPVPAMYFWMTGLLSSFLDNAPTYLVFFNTAGGHAPILMNQDAETLAAISAGAVFMGANSYIGNAPNFMVRAIAEDRGVRMPSFFGYILWSGAILIPLFAVLTLLFFR